MANSSGTEDGTPYVQIDVQLTNYDVSGPDWSVLVYALTESDYPDTAVVEVSRDEYSLEGEGYEIAPKILADNADIVAVATDLGLTLRGSDMIVGVNSFGGSSINSSGLSYQVTGEPQDVAVTVCTALGLTAEPDESDVDRASCSGGDDRSIYVSVGRNYSDRDRLRRELQRLGLLTLQPSTGCPSSGAARTRVHCGTRDQKSSSKLTSPLTPTW